MESTKRKIRCFFRASVYICFVHEEQYVNKMLVIIPPCILLLISYLSATTGLEKTLGSGMLLLLLQVNNLILVNNFIGCKFPRI